MIVAVVLNKSTRILFKQLRKFEAEGLLAQDKSRQPKAKAPPALPDGAAGLAVGGKGTCKKGKGKEVAPVAGAAPQ